MSIHCCDRMDYDLGQQCSAHARRADCPDAFIGEVRGGYGLIVHDGGGGVIEISFCPWCGKNLPPIEDLDLSAMEADDGA